MPNGKLILFAERDAWRVGVVTREGVSVTDEVDLERLAGATERDVLLALPSSQCLCATIATHDLPSRQREQAMLYRFEEKLPLAAEDIAADFIVSSETALGVGVEKHALNALLSRLTALGKRVAVIGPASLLAVQHWHESSASELVLWSVRDGEIELFRVVDGRLVAWFTMPEQADDVLMHVRFMVRDTSKPPRIVTAGVRGEIVDRLKQSGFEVVQRDPISLFEVATTAGGLALSGKRRPWIDLSDSTSRSRRDVGKASTWAAAAAIVLLACMAGAMWFRAARYAELAEQYDAQQAEIFRRVSPGQAVPVDVRSRLASEAQQAAFVVDGKSPNKPAGQGLIAFRDVMSHLPNDIRFRVYEVRLGENDFALLGEAKSHGDAQGVGDALRRRPGFVIEPPSTEQKPGGAVRFTIAGTIGSGASR